MIFILNLEQDFLRVMTIAATFKIRQKITHYVMIT